MFRFFKWIALCSVLIAGPILAKDKDVKIAVRVEKAITKLARAQDKSPQKMVEYCKEIRREVEKKFGFKFYIKEYLEWAIELIEKDCGTVFTREDLLYLAKMFNARPDSVYENIFQLCADHESPIEKAIKTDKTVKNLDNKAVLGVSIVLSGLYLCSARDPIYTYWGERMVHSGIDVCKSCFPVVIE